MKRTALITGGAGFIGTHLASHLTRQGWDVTVVDDLTEGSETNLESLGDEAELIVPEIAEPGALEVLSGRTFDAIFHLAAPASVPKSVERPASDFRANVVGALHVLEFMRRRNIPKLVFPSTVSVYSPDAQMPLKETTPIHASSPYGAAKAAAENYCFAYANSYGLNVTVLRLFNVYGPLMRKYAIYDLVRKLQRDPSRLVMLGDGNQVRDYLYVDDAVRAFVLAVEKGRKGDVYNVGSGNPVRIADLARKLADIMGLQKVSFECTMESWPGDIKTWFADLTKIAALGFTPQTPWDEGLRRTVEYLVGHPADGARKDTATSAHPSDQSTSVGVCADTISRVWN